MLPVEAPLSVHAVAFGQGCKVAWAYPKGRREGLVDPDGVRKGSRGDIQNHSDLHVG